MTQGNGNDPKPKGMQLGKQITPRLYMSYGAGLLNALGSLNMRYELTKTWLLQVEAGTSVEVDLMYSMKR